MQLNRLNRIRSVNFCVGDVDKLKEHYHESGAHLRHIKTQIRRRKLETKQIKHNTKPSLPAQLSPLCRCVPVIKRKTVHSHTDNS